MLKRHVPLLLTLLLTVRASVSGGAEEQAINVAAKELIAATDVYDESKMKQSVARLASFGTPAIPRTCTLLANDDANVRWQAVLVAEQIAIADSRLLEPLCKCAEDRDADVRGAATLALAGLFPKNPRTTKLIRQVQSDPQSLARAHAWRAAWRSSKSKDAVPPLVQLLQHKDWMTSQFAAESLKETGAAAIAPLTPLLNSRQPTRQILAMRTLAQLRRLPNDLLDRVSQLARADDRLVRLAAMKLLAAEDERRSLAWHKIRMAGFAWRRFWFWGITSHSRPRSPVN